MNKNKLIFLVILLNLIYGMVYLNCNYSVSSEQYTPVIDTLKTLESFRKEAEYYLMSYFGDYSELLDRNDSLWLYGDSSLSKRVFEKFYCSMFTAKGGNNNPYYGRNLDFISGQNYVLLTRTNPPNGYSSIAFSGMSVLGFPVGTDFDTVSFEDKQSLLNAPYYPTDGINEHGIVAALASVPSVTCKLDPAKDTILVMRWVREVLDHAQTIEEAVTITNLFNLFDFNASTLSHHLFVGDKNGNSAILEYVDGAMRVITSDENWQVVTNSYVYNKTIEELKDQCYRYEIIYNALSEVNGDISKDKAMDVMESATNASWSQWSALYDMENLMVTFCLYYNFPKEYEIKLDEQYYDFLAAYSVRPGSHSAISSNLCPLK